ncbi:unnamed protein product [Clavelina lepadiformis]|uniref:Glucoside xylosyltransferase 1 n=1 Tax=Clavelina lepadiformis TaxID=159417 RepID=A0ABP0GK47_CLALP
MKREGFKLLRLTRIKVLFIWILIVLGLYGIFGNWINKEIQRLFSKELLKPPKTPETQETIHLIAVSCGRPDHNGVRDLSKPMDQTITMLKSAAMFARSALHMHIFTEEDMMTLFSNEIASWPDRILLKVKYTVYALDYDKYIKKSLAEEWKRWYKPCGSYRLFTPLILKETTSAAIYADSDVVFIKPINELWAYLKEMKSHEVVAISPTAGHPLGGSKDNEYFISHPTGLFQINSGIMVMNFTRMLNTKWFLYRDIQDDHAEPLNYGSELLMKYYNRFKDVAEHDQKLLNIMFHYNPAIIKQLPCSWNFKNNFCRDESNICHDAELKGGAGAVHGIESSFFGTGNPTFRALYETFLRYNFESDWNEKILETFLRQLKATATGTFCETKASIIIEPLRKTLKDAEAFYEGLNIN